MALSEEDIDLLRSCMQAAVRDAPLVSEYFHEALFNSAPETRRLYRTDLSRQGELLMNRMSIIMTQMHDVQTLRPFVEDLALRHVGYGVQPEHYPLVREALLTALRRLLGKTFTPTAAAAWTEAYNEVAAIMIEIAYNDGGSAPSGQT